MTHIQHIGLAARLYTETLYFYRDVLDFPVEHESDGYCKLNAGGIMLHLHPVASESDLSVTGRGFYLSIRVEDLALTHRNLERSGVGTLHEWTVEGEEFIRVMDPEGNIVEITGPTE
jgi:catechol 2,3-dioxygenase-like lactoylglutathione lyase family enzyme